MTPILSIICPALIQRDGLSPILHDITRQAKGKPVEVLALMDNGIGSIGAKQNELNRMAKGEWIACVADDDSVAADYIDTLLEEAAKPEHADVLTFGMVYTLKPVGTPADDTGTPHPRWKNAWHRMMSTTRDAVTHMPFHPTSAFRADVVRRFTFPDVSHREDRPFVVWAGEQKLTVRMIPKVLYYAHYRRRKDEFGGESRKAESAAL